MSDEHAPSRWTSPETPDRLSGQPKIESREGEVISPAAITVGGTIAATTTIDAIMTSLYATRSADLTAVAPPVYTWVSNSPPTLTAAWPTAASVQGQACQIIARFEVRPVAPSNVAV